MRSNKYGQNATMIYREELFRLDPSFAGLASTLKLSRFNLYSLVNALIRRSAIRTGDRPRERNIFWNRACSKSRVRWPLFQFDGMESLQSRNGFV